MGVLGHGLCCGVSWECQLPWGLYPLLPLFLHLPPPGGLELLLPFLSTGRCYFHGRWYADGAVFSGDGDECTTCVCQVGADAVGDGEEPQPGGETLVRRER